MNTQKKPEPGPEQILDTARHAGVPEARIRFFAAHDDPALRDYTQLTDVALRRVREPAEGLFIAESSKIIRRATRAGMVPRSFLMSARWFADLATVIAESNDDSDPAGGPAVFIGSESAVSELTGFHLHRGALAAMHRPADRPLREVLAGARRIVVIEDVVDHTNVGAIFRSVAGLGADAVLVTPRCADPLYRRAIRVSMGTVFQVPWTRIDPWPGGIDTLRGMGFHTVALALTDESKSLRDFAAEGHEKVALIMGTEGDGLGRRTVAAADSTVLIPMSAGVDSLNVAAAAAVACFALQGE